jgi:glucan biosynthesis protein C
MQSATAVRRHDVDWLRVFATYLLFFFHTGKVFDIAPFYHIKNAALSPAMGIFTGFVHQWHMPLFFLLAGWSVFGSLRTRGAGAFLRERVSRLLIPFIAGCVLLCPLIKYVELRGGIRVGVDGHVGAASGFDDSFFQFLPTFFTQRFTWSHLWFLIYLFTFSLLYLPLLRRLMKTASSERAIGRAAIYLPIVPLALVQVTLRGRWPGFQNLYDDWANFSYYSFYFILGFLLALHPPFERAVQREWKRAGAFGLTALVLMLGTDVVGPTGPSIFLNRVLSAVAGWCCVVALLGFAARSLSFSNAALRYLSESAFPVYILHQAGIVFVGFFVIQLSAGIAAKFVLLLTGSVIATLAVYHFSVRPFAPLRFLFGMKSRPSGQAAPSGTIRSARAAAPARM